MRLANQSTSGDGINKITRFSTKRKERNKWKERETENKREKNERKDRFGGDGSRGMENEEDRAEREREAYTAFINTSL